MLFALRVGKNTGLQKVQIAYCCEKFCCSRTKTLNSKTEQRINLKFLVKLNETSSESLQAATKVYGEECMSRAQVFARHKRFREGRTNVEDDECSGRPTTSKTTSIIREIEKIVGKDCRLSIRLIAERMSMDKEEVRQILHDNL